MPENRYHDVEADVNGAGYQLLNAGRSAPAIVVFHVNTLLYPNSANTFDSLGEAYERAGQRDAAIAAYRKAIAMNPGMGSSREGLRRLGATS
jgi:Flp pilus assembly protein TadD